MASDELYKLAVEYNKQKLWYNMSSDQLFGVKLDDGRIAYCSVLGRHEGEGCALAVYVSKTELDCLRHSEINFEENITDNEAFILKVSQSCLRLILAEKDDLSDEELKAEKIFSKRNKIYFRAKHSHPRFMKFKPLCSARQITDVEDEKILMQAISAAIEVSKKFPYKLPHRIQFSDRIAIRRKFPLLTLECEKYKWTMEHFPPFRRVQFPVAKLNPEQLKKLTAKKKSGTYCCEIFILPKTAYVEDEDVSKFPVTLITYDQTKKRKIEMDYALDYIARPEILTAAVVKTFLAKGVPKKIFVRNERTYYFLEKFCEQVGIELLDAEDDLQEIEIEEENIIRELKIESLSEDEYIIQLLDLVENVPAEELKHSLDQELKDLLEELYNDDVLTDELDAKIEKILFDDED